MLKRRRGSIWVDGVEFCRANLWRTRAFGSDPDRFGALRILLARPEPKLMKSKKLQPKETPGRDGGALNDNAAPQTASGTRSIRGLPWIWIALTALATLVWLVGIGWAAVKLFRWLVD